MSEHTEAGGLVERLRDFARSPEYRDHDLYVTLREAATTIEALSASLASERAAHAATKRERDEARQALREARREISKTHKSAVKHENCERQHCPICEGGLFQCADCGAAEIETEQRVCTGSETRLAEALKALVAIECRPEKMIWGEDSEVYAAMRDMEDIARRVREGASMVDAVDIAALEVENARLKARLGEALNALEPLTRLEIPEKPQGNAGAYSILHDSIRAARRVREGGKADG